MHNSGMSHVACDYYDGGEPSRVGLHYIHSLDSTEHMGFWEHGIKLRVGGFWKGMVDI